MLLNFSDILPQQDDPPPHLLAYSRMAASTDSRFRTDDRFEEPEAGPSKPLVNQDLREDNSASEADGDDEDEELLDGLAEGMDVEGFSGPSEKAVKPLTKEELSVFKAAQERTGVVYISRIPPGMRPTKVRHLMSGYGEVGRVYLQPEGA